ncbi:hypothetical protein [Leyella stercorea]|uniref:hypothetical protein n=1 Tax=Leyella stercorea TaxID=363265 RepID=UPI002432C0FE|nr:hypothetical protein [Leyella stercorea]
MVKIQSQEATLHTLLYMVAPQHLNTSTPQHLNASTPQRLNTSTSQHLFYL